MNLVGHFYIASKVTGALDSLTAAGSQIPDIVPFVENSVFSFDEIHERSNNLLRFLDKRYPKKRNVALAMMSHSVKFGADKFNKEINSWLLKDKKIAEKITQGISECSGVSFEVAAGPRMHNYLWLGLDLYILKNKKDFIKKCQSVFPQIDIEEVTKLLYSFYEKPIEKIKDDLEVLFEPVKPETFESTEGLIKYWKIFLSQLPEGDNVDVEKTAKLAEFIYEQFKDEWKGILTKVEKGVLEKMKPYTLG